MRSSLPLQVLLQLHPHLPYHLFNVNPHLPPLMSQQCCSFSLISVFSVSDLKAVNVPAATPGSCCTLDVPLKLPLNNHIYFFYIHTVHFARRDALGAFHRFYELKGRFRIKTI